MRPMHIETAGRNEHVGDIERVVRVIKERSRCTTSHLRYQRMTRIMINNNIEDKVHWLNAFAPEDYISKSISPAGLVLREGKPQVKFLKLDFGQYCQVYNGTDSMMKLRSVGAIALRPHNNRGSYSFMSLNTGKKIHSNQWTELAINEEVIKRVEELAEAEGINEMINGELTFEWAPGVPIAPIDEQPEVIIEDTEENEHGIITYEDITDEDDEEDDPSITEIDEQNIDDDVINTSENADDVDEDQGSNTIVSEPDDNSNGSDKSSENEETETSVEPVSDPEDDSSFSEPENLRSDNQHENLRSDNVEEGRRHSTRERAPRNIYEPTFGGNTYERPNYGVQLFSLGTKQVPGMTTTRSLNSIAVNILFTQMNAEKGFDLVGERAIAAIFKEYSQMKDMKVFK